MMIAFFYSPKPLILMIPLKTVEGFDSLNPSPGFSRVSRKASYKTGPKA